MSELEESKVDSRRKLRLANVLAAGSLLPHGHLTILLLGTCAMRCKTCFGPEYDRRGSVTVAAWLASVRDFWLPQGIKKITISGGEPLLWRDVDGATVDDLVVGLRALDPELIIVISTIGRGRGRKTLLDMPGILLNASEIGLPLYGLTPEAHGEHQRMFSGQPNTQGWHDVVAICDAVPDLQRETPLRVEIRSVPGVKNWTSLVRLPELLARWDRIPELVWCLYEANFLTGPIRQAYRREFELAASGPVSFGAFLEEVCGPIDYTPQERHRRYPIQGLEHRSIMPYPVVGATGKYMFGDPDGLVTVELVDGKCPSLFSPVRPIGHISRPDELMEGFRELKANYGA